MKKSSAIATFLFVLSAGATGVGAMNMNGSDTMFDLTKCVITACKTAHPSSTVDTITYVGGGSGTGESAMVNGTNTPAQVIAPMSSKLSQAGACNTTNGSGGVQTEYLHVAMDGVSIIAPDAQIAGCGTLATTAAITVTSGSGDGTCPGCSGSTYTFTDWKDLLKVLWGGKHHDASGTRDCNSDVRNTIVASYGKVYQTPGSCTNANCTSIRHIWRRDDLSGTTDTFRSLIGINKPTDNPPGFCNGQDGQDLDPIRVTCDLLDTTHTNPAEQVCGFDHKIGFLQSIVQPETAPDAIKYNSTACARGVFDFAPLPTRAAATCPDGQASNFGKCLFPQDASNHWGCLNLVARNVPLGASPSGDPRAYNAILRNADGTIVKDTNNREMSGAYYRIHTTSAFTGGSPCTQPSSTRQIGCLTQASPCSIGFAGLEAGTAIAGVSPNAVNGLLPTTTNIRQLLTDPDATLDTTYKLGRFLRLSTLKGFGSTHITDPAQKDLANCYNDQSVVFNCTTSAGYITLADTVGGAPTSQCEDFDESLPTTSGGCGASSNNNACTNVP